MLQLKNLTLQAGGKAILSDISAVFESGKTSVILGKNGSGKTTLVRSIAGDPHISIPSGSIFLGDQDITNDAPEIRSKAGIFLAFQHIPELKGLTVRSFLSSVLLAHKIITPAPASLYQKVFPMLKPLGLDVHFLDRDLGSGLSGGEKRKFEFLQFLCLSPKVALFDEIDAGVDIDTLRILADQIVMSTPCTRIVISHNFHFIRSIQPDTIFLLENGILRKLESPSMLDEIEKSGFTGKEE
jgi:Fe-S cluster assembly ATP-binding protein